MNVYDRFPQDDNYNHDEALRRMWRDGFAACQRNNLVPVYGEFCNKHGERMKSVLIGGIVKMFYCEVCCLEAVEASLPAERHTDRLDTPARPFPALNHIRGHFAEQETQHGLSAINLPKEPQL